MANHTQPLQLNTFFIDKKLLLLNGKRPLKSMRGWNETSFEGIDPHGTIPGNVGWIPGDGYLIIDVDVKKDKPGRRSFKKLQDDLGIKIPITVKTPSGGIHCYIKIDEEVGSIKYNIEDYPGIDFISGNGHYVVIPPSKNYKLVDNDIDMLGVTLSSETPGLTDLIESDDFDDFAGDDDGDDFTTIGDYGIWTDAKIRSHLSRISVDGIDYETWFKIGMALHNADEDNFDVYHEWSRGDLTGEDPEEYKGEDDVRDKWDSFHQGGGVTMGYIWHLSRTKESEVIDYINEFGADLNIDELLRILASYIIDNGDTGILADDTYKEYKNAVNNPMTKPAFMKLLKERVKKQRRHENDEKKKSLIKEGIRSAFVGDILVREIDIFKGIVKINSANTFVDLKSRDVFLPVGYGEHIVEAQLLDQGIDRVSRSMYITMALKEGWIESYGAVEFDPSKEDTFINDDGQRTLNLYTPPNFKKTKPQDASIIYDHCINLCNGNKDNADTLLMWMAHVVQRPEVRIRWVPLLVGPQGAGKGLIYSLLSEVFPKYSTRVRAEDMVSGFNDYFDGNVIVEGEDFGLGYMANKSNLNSALKTAITADRVMVNRKFRPKFKAKVFINMMVTLNDASVIEIDKGDRRYFLIETNESEWYLDQDYFKALFNLDGYNIFNYLNSISIDDLNINRAPKTKYKMETIENNKESKPYFNEILEHCGDRNFVLFKELYDDIYASTGKRPRLLTLVDTLKSAFGFTICSQVSDEYPPDGRAMLRGEKHKIYLRGEMKLMKKREVYEEIKNWLENSQF